MEMTKEELLEKAKRDYPIGTVFRSPVSGWLFTCNDIPKWNSDRYTILVTTIEYNSGNKNVGRIYGDEEWAEIVSKPEVKVEFEIGKWYKFSSTYHWYAKFREITENRFVYSDLIHDDSLKKYEHQINDTCGWIISNMKNITLLTDLSEIQEYLPEGHVDKLPVKQETMKELTELPEKWCIRPTKNSEEILNKYFHSIGSKYEGYTGKWEVNSTISPMNYYHFPQNSINCWGEITVKPGYTEITFEQFKKWVLKETDETKVPDVPEYVECIGSGYSYCTHKSFKEYGCINYSFKSCTNGIIYKIIKAVKINDNIDGYSCSYEGLDYLIGKVGVKPSTKEAYDEQERKKTMKVEEEKWTPKDGDWAYKFNGSDIGTVYKIEKVTDRSFYVKDFGTYTIPSEYWRKALPHEIPVEAATKMEPVVDMEAILEEANKRFKVGMKGISRWGTPFTLLESAFPLKICDKEISDAGENWLLYYNGQWATVQDLKVEPKEDPKDVRKQKFIDWYQKNLPPHLAKMAIENFDPHFSIIDPDKNINHYLGTGFNWSMTSQGYDFWEVLRNHIRDKNDISTYGIRIRDQVISSSVNYETGIDSFEYPWSTKDVRSSNTISEIPMLEPILKV